MPLAARFTGIIIRG